MTNKVLIVHDGRIPGGAGAVVLARLLRRAGHPAVKVHHLLTGQNAQFFWTAGADGLLSEADRDTKLIIFGVTFYDIDKSLALSRLSELKDAYGDLEVWSHRWPDGYSNFVAQVRIPPQDIVYGPLGFELTPPEKRLLRLSLLAARAIPVVNHDADIVLIDALAQAIDTDARIWEQLVDAVDLEALFREVETAMRIESRADHAYVVETTDDYIEIEIDRKHVSYEIRIIDDLLDQLDERSTRVVIIAWLANDRLLLCRRDPHLGFPSLRWLIDNRYSNLVPSSLRDRVYGPQDSVYFHLGAQDRKSVLRPAVRELAKKLAVAPTGGRYLTAAAARDIAALANDVFRTIDLTRRYTSEDPKIEVAATDLYDLIHTSSRTGRRRRTLTMPIRVKGPEATAFFFTDGGYNFQKAERILEGAILGLGKRGVGWLGVPQPSERLRLDIRPMLDGRAGEGIAAVRRSLAEPRIKSISSTGLVTSESVIGRFLGLVGLDRLVTIAESETIGPSIAHALTLRAAALALNKPARDVAVLDLFAGSGVANRLLSREGCYVTSVDLFVSASSVGLYEPGATRPSDMMSLWLRADARAVVDLNSPLVERNYDVIGLDPPHSELVELLFGVEGNESLVSLCARRARILVLYQGHSTQRGRLSLIESGLTTAGWVNQAILQVEEELIVVAATEQIEGKEFDILVGRIIADVQTFVERNELGDISAVRLDMHSGWPQSVDSGHM